jgi:hypothetical protein
MFASTEALFLPRGLGRGSSEHLPTASRRHIAGRATPECVATAARVKDLAERNLPPAQNGRKRQRASEGAQMHSRERDSPNSRWTYALHAHCDRMPSMFGHQWTLSQMATGPADSCQALRIRRHSRQTCRWRCPPAPALGRALGGPSGCINRVYPEGMQSRSTRD